MILNCLINFSFNLIFALMDSEILRKLNSKKTVTVIISIIFVLKPILVNSKPIIVGKEIIKQENAMKL